MIKNTAYQSLLLKLDEFIRKYYKNEMIKGAMYSVALILGAYLLVTLLEYVGRFNVTMRSVLFYSFVVSGGAVLVRYFIIPLFKMYRLGSVISHEQAALIIGRHFPSVQDKLLNTLQLHETEVGGSDNSLLEASIGQKISEMRPVPFSSAIDLRQNRKYLKYALPPVAVILILLFAAPSVLTKPTDRLLRHGQVIAEEAPFSIRVLNENLETPENEDFTIEVKVSPNASVQSAVPDKVYLVLGDQQFLLTKEDKLSFNYTFRNVQKDTRFHFSAAGFDSDEYTLGVIPAPQLVDFHVELTFPAYIHRNAEKMENTGDLTVPAGTAIRWQFTTRNTEELDLRFEDKTDKLKTSDNKVTYSATARNTTSYSIRTSNARLSSRDSIVYRIQVIPDLHPQISVNEERDSTSYKRLYFSGEVKDDYGFKKLTFNYQFQPSEDGTVPAGQEGLKTIELPVSRELTDDEFFHSWDLGELGIRPGDRISYYFEVWDNDGYLGSKSARSGTHEYAAPTDEELQQDLEQQNEDIKDKLEESIDDAAKLQKELEELQRQLMEKSEMSWQDKKRLEEMMKQQQELQKQVEELQKQNQQKNQKQNEFQKPNDSLSEKQKQLEELMNQVMTPELQKMMEELQRLMEQLNKDEIQKELDKMDLSNEDMEKELDRALEQFKQLEWEQKMEKTIEKLEKLADEQDKLSQESDKKDTKSEELKKEQEELNKEFEEIKKEIDEAEKLNQELEDPNKMPDTEQKENEINEEQKKSSDELEKNKKPSASKSQKSASQKMKDMAQQMSMSMESNESEQQSEDMEALRALLENIITLSFDQESLMANFKDVDNKDPKFNKYAQVQRKLKDDARMVEDSLFALSKRVPQLSAAVNHEINLVNDNMEQALDEIQERRVPEITTHQQYVMTSFNNLALMLDEALKQMQKESSCSKPGNGNCEKPGGFGKKPSASDIKKMQEALSKQLGEAKKQGQNKGENNSGKEGMSKQLAEMAAKQAAIRQAMEDKAGELNEDGSGNGNELKQIAKDMEDLQRDIVNDQIDEETLKRQQDILIRLLKAENAERIRDQDNERKSNEARQYPTSNPARYEEYMKRKEQETELLRTVPPALKPYYRDKVNAYFNKLGGQ